MDDGVTHINSLGPMCNVPQAKCLGAGYELWNPAGSPPIPSKGIQAACQCPGGAGGAEPGQYGEVQCLGPKRVVGMPSDECRRMGGTAMPNEQCYIVEGGR